MGGGRTCFARAALARGRLAATLVASAALVFPGCAGERNPGDAPEGETLPGAELASPGAADTPRPGSADTPTPPSATEPPGEQVPPAVAPEEPSTQGCPAGDMALIAGGYCAAVEQRCLAWQEVQVGGTIERNQCRLYASPSTCLRQAREPMRFCMDRYEWPNRRGELPRVLVSWQDARELCASRGKRLCTEEEFNFACEGEQMLPHVYGHERDATKCSIDRPYRERTFTFQPWEPCLADPACRAAFEAIDQRLPAGAMTECRSPAGVHDLNGNVNEWVILPRNETPHRSGIKGGWWGPVRNRCRPTVTFHDEGDWGYEVGFRCCADASP